MSSVLPRLLLIAALSLFAAGGLDSAALAAGLTFSPPAQLPHGDPNATPFFSGGEPSIAFDPTADGHVYVTAPQGIPSAVGGLQGGNSKGVGYWASADHGASFPVSGLTGTGLGGGDSDVEVRGDHGVLVADLEAIDTAICTSTDFAKTFPSCANPLTAPRSGPDNDREWLTRGTKGEIYLTYHDFVGGFPIIEKSTDGGRSFLPCGLIIDPTGPAQRTYSPTGGTLVSKPVIGKDGSIYVEFSTPDLVSSPVGAAIKHVYMAVARGGCNATTVFKNHVIYQDPGASLGNIFQAAAIDGGDQLYALAAGQTKAGQGDSGLYLFTSSDHGTTWSAPIKANPPNLKANVFPALAGGQGAGEVALGWFGTETSGDPNAGNNQWRFYAAETYDGGRTFAQSTVTPDPAHYGDICTQGLFCGLVPGQPGNRNLADFASLATDPASGCVAAAIPADPYNRPDQPNGADSGSSSAYVALQQHPSTCLTAANAGRAADSVVAEPATCRDATAPMSRFKKLERATARRRRGITLNGTTSDRGCAKGRGRVAKVQVALGRKSKSKCRFARSNGRFGPRVSCRRTRYLSARGTARWHLAFGHRLARGRYFAWSRATDAAGNVERKNSRRNRIGFRVR